MQIGALPPPAFPIVDKDGKPTHAFAQYLHQLDLMLRAYFHDMQGLINAANDGAAATAGVQIGQLYRTGNAVQIRLT